jgi:NNP family nitrate/nitrite transporter-like MFS transporter
MDHIKVKGSPSGGLLGTTLGFFFGFAAVALYGPTAINFKEALDLSPAQVGILVAIPSLTGSLLRIPFGTWVDITGGRKPFMILLVLSVLGLGGVNLLLHFAYPDNMKGLYGLILLLGMMSGCGIATFSVGIAQTSYWFPVSKQGRVLGIYAGMGNLAPGLFSLIIPFYLQSYGFKSAYFAWFLFLLAGSVLYFFLGKNSYYFQFKRSGFSDSDSISKSKEYGQELFPSGAINDSFIKSVKSANTWKLIVLYFTSFGGFIALTAWFPLYWCDHEGFSHVMGGILTAAFSISASLIRVIGGVIADKSGGEKTSMFSIFLVFAGSLLMVFSTGALSIIAALLLAAGMGINNAAVFKLVPVYVPEAIGGAAGLIGGLGAFGGFLIPPALGVFISLSGVDGYSRGFILFTILSVLSFFMILSLYTKRKYK